MNKQQISCLIALLASTVTDAETIRFNKGDTLTVELIKQTKSTLTFFHYIIGEETVRKETISNLSDIDLKGLIMLPEGEAGIAAEKVIAANKKLVQLKGDVDIALGKVRISEQTLQNAKPEEVEAAEKALQLANTTLSNVQEKLVAAVDGLDKAKSAVKVAKELSRANEQVAIAQGYVILAEKKVKLAKQALKMAQQATKTAKQAVHTATPDMANIAEMEVSIAKTKTDIIKDKVEIAEENLKVTKEKLKAVENLVILAKGKQPNDGLLGTGWFQDWESNIEIGLLGAAGSSVNTTFRTAFNGGHEDKAGRWTFKSFYYYSSEDKVTSNNKVYATLVKDWFFEDTKWFAFASTTYGMDTFKDWRHRLQLSVGPGYQFVKTDRWEFSGRMAGTGIFQFDRHINGVAAPNKYSFEAMVGADLIWRITEKQRFTVSNYFYTNLTDTGAYRNLTTLTWLHDIEWLEGLSIKFGIRNEYDTTQPIPDEFKYNLSLVWGF